MKTCVGVQIFVGTICPLPETGRPTGMYKKRVSESIELGGEGFVGDHQADRRVHGGVEKAVHLFPVAHYRKLSAQFPDSADRLIAGSIGENISADIDEHDVRIGDIWTLGTTRLQVCQPRNPCWKIDERYQADGMAQFIAQHHLTGWYWRVLQPGVVRPTDQLILVSESNFRQTLFESMVLWAEHRPNIHELELLSAAEGVAGEWKVKIDKRLDWLKSKFEQAS